MPEHYGLETFRRRKFAGAYRGGHHVAFFGPTQQAGKSTLSFALQEAVIQVQPEITPTVLCMKHTDRVIAHWTERLGYRETPRWPPVRKVSEYKMFSGPPAGHTLWPHQSLSDEDADNALLEREFRKAIVHNRKHRPSITVANELYGMLAELHLRTLLTAVVTRDSIAGHGLWYESQKPSGTQGISIPGFFFNSAEWMFLSKDGEERNRRRYAEIACGINPRDIERETLALDPFSWLCIRRSGPQWCVVDAYDPSFAVL
jgi:hypothetical protein